VHSGALCGLCWDSKGGEKVSPVSIVVKPEIMTDSGLGYSKFSSIIEDRDSSLAADMHCYFNCGEVFKKGYDLQVHIRLRHKGEDAAELARAEEDAKFEIALTKRSACLYKCALCEKSVEGWATFWEHLRKHKISVADYKAKYGTCEIKTVKFQCRICLRVMKHESNIIHKHLQWVHGINWSQYLARVRLELRGIQPVPLPDLVKKEHCKICGESIKYIRQHLKNTHRVSEEQYQQLIRDGGFEDFKGFDFNQNLQRVIKPTTPDFDDSSSLSAFSDASSKPPTSLSSLRKPSKAEMSDKTVKKCSACQIQFQTRREFIHHCQIVHSIRFKTKSQAQQGLPQVEKEVSKYMSADAPTPPPNFHRPSPSKVSKIVWPDKRDSLGCGICGQNFPTWRHLDQHMKFVCKKVKCESCGKTYSNMNNLRKHKKSCKFRPLSSVMVARGIVEEIVSSVLRMSPGPSAVLSCSVPGCGQQFGRKGHLRRHLVNYHNE